MERGKNVEKKGLVQLAANPDNNLEITRKQEGEHKVLRAQVRIVQVERACPPFVASDQRFS